MKRRITRSAKKADGFYNLHNCFGFEDSEIDLPLFNSTMTSTGEENRYVEFQPDKPFRLSLYPLCTNPAKRKKQPLASSNENTMASVNNDEITKTKAKTKKPVRKEDKDIENWAKITNSMIDKRTKTNTKTKKPVPKEDQGNENRAMNSNSMFDKKTKAKTKTKTSTSTKTKTKTKKPVPKEDQDFENWAKNMNSMFDDVENFELSINYDD